MADVLRIKRRASGAPGAPGTLASAEIAYNEVDHVLYYGEGNSGGNAVTIAAIAGQGLASSAAPAMNGTAAAGTATQWAHGDHVHPSDTSRAPAATTVTSVTGTAPVVSSGGTTPAISMPAATTSVNGYLTSADWN